MFLPSSMFAVEDAGVVHQYVQRAEFTHRHVGSRLPLIGLRHVEVDESRGVAQFLCQRVAFVVEDVPGDDPGAFGDQRPRMRGAHTASAPTDQCNFSVYASHGGSGYRGPQQRLGVPERGVELGKGQIVAAAQVNLDLVLRLAIAPEDRQYDEFR